MLREPCWWQAVVRVVVREVLGFRLALSFLLLEAFGRTVTSTPSRESRGYLFIGSMGGLLLSGLLPQLEAALRSLPSSRRKRNRKDSS
jgi:hypothetical protein